VRVASIDYVGENLSAAHPNLEGLTDLVFEKLPPKEAAAGMDVVFLGLPHKVSGGTVPELLDSGAKIIDLSGDFRLKDVAAYEQYYGAKHPAPELLAEAVYGLPEQNRELPSRRRASSPPPAASPRRRSSVCSPSRALDGCAAPWRPWASRARAAAAPRPRRAPTTPSAQ
jgi:N-acetyl-gamma-glutamyl-phosphate/LysW-gamma-L-alpha-aminoadipyl-6-phosphate reductase